MTWAASDSARRLIELPALVARQAREQAGHVRSRLEARKREGVAGDDGEGQGGLPRRGIPTQLGRRDQDPEHEADRRHEPLTQLSSWKISSSAPAEEAGDREGQRQRRQVPAGLDRVDRLARDVQLLGELALAQAPALAQLAHLVGHGCKASLSAAGVKDLCHLAGIGQMGGIRAGAVNSRSRSLLSWRRR